MADEKLNTGPGEEKLPEAPAPVTVDEPQAPAPEQTAAPTPQQEGPAQAEYLESHFADGQPSCRGGCCYVRHSRAGA